MARQHGSHGDLMLDKTGAGTTYTRVASINGWTLDLARDKVDVTAFQDTNKQYVMGLADVKGTYKGWWDPLTTPTDLTDVILGTVAPFIKLIPSTLSATVYFSGLGYLDGSVSVDAAGACSIAGTFVAAGPWTLVHP